MNANNVLARAGDLLKSKWFRLVLGVVIGGWLITALLLSSSEGSSLPMPEFATPQFAWGFIDLGYYSKIAVGLKTISGLLAGIMLLASAKIVNAISDNLGNQAGPDVSAAVAMAIPFLALLMSSYVNQAILLIIFYGVISRDRKSRQPVGMIGIYVLATVLGVNWLNVHYPEIALWGARIAEETGVALIADLSLHLAKGVHFTLNAGNLGFVVVYAVIIYNDVKCYTENSLDATAYEATHFLWGALTLISGNLTFTNMNGAWINPIENPTAIFADVYQWGWMYHFGAALVISIKEQLRLATPKAVVKDGVQEVKIQYIKNAERFTYPVLFLTGAFVGGYGLTKILTLSSGWILPLIVGWYFFQSILIGTPWKGFLYNPETKIQGRTTMENVTGDIAITLLPGGLISTFPNNTFGFSVNLVTVLMLLFTNVAKFFGLS